MSFQLVSLKGDLVMYERDEQTIGRYQVSVRGSGWDLDVIMRVIAINVERNLTPSEALLLLEWLNTHKDEFYQAAQKEQKGVEP